MLSHSKGARRIATGIHRCKRPYGIKINMPLMSAPHAQANFLHDHLVTKMHAHRYLQPVLGLVLALIGVHAWAATEEQPAEFTLPDRNGKTHHLSDYRGQWVLVNYWATWCPPCREEIPELELFHANSDGRAVVLGVNMESIDAERLATFLDEQFVSYPILLAGSRPEPDRLVGKVPGLPTTYLVTPEGKVVARQVGGVTAEAIRTFIENYEKRAPGGL